MFYQFCDNCIIPSWTYYLKEAEMKIVLFAHFKEYHVIYFKTNSPMLSDTKCPFLKKLKFV